VLNGSDLARKALVMKGSPVQVRASASRVQVVTALAVDRMGQAKYVLNAAGPVPGSLWGQAALQRKQG
jgi:hypothetical protein